ncbi:hypothetical protein A3SI_14951 [Nitritalea halalkaliphila LW7]|uniref:Right handed beta helix domain-containing protein n=1 Tax=Nitritalea halalkaliphila LW7 TaxID=1189621 RepID=I5BZ42_9BACT|nr:right-handed parallel beta-helix repeat-containing protein [Nitritalea halalkaliphila]EIM74844.1 hypothetical protein A3SI_14951 [Nitritalea halalkaliphila LW7]
MQRVSIHTFGIRPIDSQIQGYRFVDTFYSELEIRPQSSKCFYLLWAEQTGEVYYPTILTNGQGTHFRISRTGPHLLKDHGGSFSVEPVSSYLSEEMFKGFDFRGKEVFFPRGTYVHVQAGGVNTLFYFEKNQPERIKGAGESATTLLGMTNKPARELPAIHCRLEDISCHNIVPTAGSLRRFESVYIQRVSLHYHSITQSSSYLLYIMDEGADVFIENLTLRCQAIYAGIWVERANDVHIAHSTLATASASHPIRINSYRGRCLIDSNTVSGANITGILIATQRRALIRGAEIVHNTVSGCAEESISIDSFGNNVGLVPVICKSYVQKVAPWRVDGVLKGTCVYCGDLFFVEPKKQGGGYQHRVVDVDFIGSIKGLLFVVESGNLAYQYAEIRDFAPAGQSICLYLSETYTAEELEGAEIGVHTGAINCTIAGNEVRDTQPNANQPGHAISLWGASYGNAVLNNRIDNCRQGIHVAGFGSFGLQRPDFFNHAIQNMVEGNVITNCKESFAIRTFYGSKKGYGNRFNNNHIRGGTFEIKHQLEFEMLGNVLEDTRVPHSLFKVWYRNSGKCA